MKTIITSLKLHSIGASVFLSGAAFLPAQVLVYNGSFEIGSPVGGEVDAVNSTTIPGWTVTSGNIDYYDSSRWQAADGSRSLDMSGTTAGTISQNVGGLVSGQNYVLSFFMAGNPEGNGIYGVPNLRPMQVSIGSDSQTFTFNETGFTASNMGWTQNTLDFTATDSTMTLTFESQVVGWYGPALDNVSITPVPEPSSAVLGTLAAGLAACWKRKSRG